MSTATPTLEQRGIVSWDVILRVTAAKYASTLLVTHPEEALSERAFLGSAIVSKAEWEGECRLIEDLESALERSDAEPAVTARLIFAALGRDS